MSSTFNVTAFPALSGGLPTQPDQTPSIVFAVAYAVLLLPTLWRTYTYRVPTRLLITFVRLALFDCVRIATFALRAIEAASAQLPDNPVPSTGIFIAEQILLGIGFIVLVDLLVELLKSHIWRTDVPVESQTAIAQEGRGTGLQRIVRAMHVALIVAIALGITAGSQMQNPSSASNVKTFRTVSLVISLIVAVLVVLVSALLLLQYPHLGATPSLYLLVTGCLVVVVPVYRLVSATSTPTLADLVSSSTRLKFYLLQGLIEWLVAAALILVDARVWFFAGGEDAQMMLAGSGYDPSQPGSVEQIRLNGTPQKYDTPQHAPRSHAGGHRYPGAQRDAGSQA